MLYVVPLGKSGQWGSLQAESSQGHRATLTRNIQRWLWPEHVVVVATLALVLVQDSSGAGGRGGRTGIWAKQLLATAMAVVMDQVAAA